MTSLFLRRAAVALVTAAVLTAGAASAGAQDATSALTAPDGSAVGTVRLSETPHGVLLSVRIDKAPPGTHGFHIHAIGTCAAGDFKSSGGHYAPRGHEHGIRNARGRHAGDLPNIHVAADGTLNIDILAEAVSLNSGGARAPLFDADGSAFIMHAGADDLTSQPSGAAGARIACGVIKSGR